MFRYTLIGIDFFEFTENNQEYMIFFGNYSVLMVEIHEYEFKACEMND